MSVTSHSLKGTHAQETWTIHGRETSEGFLIELITRDHLEIRTPDLIRTSLEELIQALPPILDQT